MKLLPLLLSSSALVAAAPIRIIVTSFHKEHSNVLPAPVIRIGHPAVNIADIARIPIVPHVASEPFVEALPIVEPPVPVVHAMGHKKPCPGRKGMGRIPMPNWLKQFFGLNPPELGRFLVDPNSADVPHAHPTISPEGDFPPPPHSRPHHRHPHHYQHGFHHRHGSFFRRLHFALMSLGPWEGRAVAFVLGCGIGVLLRMFWVLSVIAMRSVRGHPEPEGEIQFEITEEEYLVAPPEYTDEKVALVQAQTATA